MNNHKIDIQYDQGNPRRYGKPWIARVTAWPANGRPELEWGQWYDGANAYLQISAASGDIIRWGIFGDRRGDRTEALWGIVEDDGSVTETDQAEARRHWESQHERSASVAQ